MLGHGTTFANAVVTCNCSLLSLVGSVLIILSYMIVRTKSTPKTAFLILHLAISDFFWFLTASVLSSLWLTGEGNVPDGLCLIVSPTIIFTRMASLFWTVAISFNVLMSVQKRKWSWKSQENDFDGYRKTYFGVICLFALPGTILNMSKQYSSKDNAQLGCSPQYEPLGVWYEIMFPEVLPIVFAFCCNMYVFLNVRHRMSKAPVPQSVRKKRKRIMYHYIIVCILCWIPTILLYLMEMAGVHSPELEIIARTSLYLSGFLNFLVFGLQDPHLSRSFFVILKNLGLSRIFFTVQYSSLKSSDVEKSVMFQEPDIREGGSRRSDLNRIRKLSREDKLSLYDQRPDLDPQYKADRVGQKKKRMRSGSASSSASGSSGVSDDKGLIVSSSRNTPILTKHSKQIQQTDGLDSFFDLSLTAMNELQVSLLSETIKDPGPFSEAKDDTSQSAPNTVIGVGHVIKVKNPSPNKLNGENPIHTNVHLEADIEQRIVEDEVEEYSISELSQSSDLSHGQAGATDDSSEDEIDDEDDELDRVFYT